MNHKVKTGTPATTKHASNTRYTFSKKDDLQQLGKAINSANREKLKSVIKVGVQTGVQVINSLETHNETQIYGWLRSRHDAVVNARIHTHT